jgi:hypothetical protein
MPPLLLLGVSLQTWYGLLLMAKQSKHPWLWFIGLWLAGVLTVTAISYAVRFLMLGFN